MLRVNPRPLLLGAAILMALTAASPPAQAEGRSAAEARIPPPTIMDKFFGWIEIDLAQTWSVPSPAARLTENELHFFIPRFRSRIVITPYAASNPPMVAIQPRAVQYWLMARQRIEPDPDLPDMCIGSIVTFRGDGRTAGFNGGAMDAGNGWGIPGLRFTASGSDPEITFLGGDCEPGRAALERSLKTALQAVLSLPGDGMWFFEEGIRWPRNSARPMHLEGKCEAPLYSQSGGRIQCQWVAHRVPVDRRLAPPRRR